MTKTFKNKAFNSSNDDVKPRTIITTQSNTFNSVFDPKPIDENEKTRIQSLLVGNYKPGSFEEKKLMNMLNPSQILRLKSRQ